MEIFSRPCNWPIYTVIPRPLWTWSKDSLRPKLFSSLRTSWRRRVVTPTETRYRGSQNKYSHLGRGGNRAQAFSQRYLSRSIGSNNLKVFRLPYVMEMWHCNSNFFEHLEFLRHCASTEYSPIIRDWCCRCVNDSVLPLSKSNQGSRKCKQT
jgi:hypothetical protein